MPRLSWRLGGLSVLALLGCLVWVGVYLGTARAAEVAIVVQPASAPKGTPFRVYATGLPPATEVQTRIRRPNNTTTTSQVYRSDAGGVVAFAYLSQAEDSTGLYTAEVEYGPSLLTASFTVGAASRPGLTVFPTVGSNATTFRFIGAGFAPAQRVDLILERSDGLTQTLASTASAAGGVAVALPAGGMPLGPYALTAQVAGQAVARGQFRLEPLPSMCRDLLANPSFEDKPDFLGWDTAGDPLVTDLDAIGGRYMAFLGGADNLHDVIAQGVTIPTDTQFAELSYWRARVPQANPGADQMQVLWTDASGRTLTTIETVGATSLAGFWERRVVPVAYPGQTVRLTYDATTDARNSTAWGVDETALVVCQQAPPLDVGPRDATMRPVPSRREVAPGAVVTVDVWVENVIDLFGADVTLHFDPTLLRPRSSQVRVGGLLNDPGVVVTRNQVGAAQGTAHLVITRVAPLLPISGSGVLFSLEFDALALGDSALTLTPALASAPGGVPIPLALAGASVRVARAPASVGGQVHLGGRLSSSGVTVQVSGLSAGTTTTNSRGDFRVDGLTPGPATVTVRKAGWLCATRDMTLASGRVEPLPLVELVAGDVNGDDTINIFDLVRVAFHYDEPASADPVADLNGSGAIDLGDLVLVAANYGKSCPQPWTASAAKRALRLTVAQPKLTLQRGAVAADGTVTLDVWAEGLNTAVGLDLSLAVGKGATLVEEAGFKLDGSLPDLFVVRNTVAGGTARLVFVLVGTRTPLTGKVHLASLKVKGDPAAVRVARLVTETGPAAKAVDDVRAAKERRARLWDSLQRLPPSEPETPGWRRPLVGR
ncbi:MAG: carboxypeptidase regulatory-like domain-containing protein [Anaerolineae bacterium]|nr:carboxypeptidase regulatory-like domain-containing protein [Anaerolineae bacterium]